MYGFKRVTQDGPEQGAYYHELFIRNQPLLSTKIKRKQGPKKQKGSSPQKGGKSEQSEDADEEVPTSSSSLGKKISQEESAAAPATSAAAPNSTGSEDGKARTDSKPVPKKDESSASEKGREGASPRSEHMVSAAASNAGEVSWSS